MMKIVWILIIGLVIVLGLGIIAVIWGLLTFLGCFLILATLAYSIFIKHDLLYRPVLILFIAGVILIAVGQFLHIEIMQIQLPNILSYFGGI